MKPSLALSAVLAAIVATSANTADGSKTAAGTTAPRLNPTGESHA